MMSAVGVLIDGCISIDGVVAADVVAVDVAAAVMDAVAGLLSILGWRIKKITKNRFIFVIFRYKRLKKSIIHLHVR